MAAKIRLMRLGKMRSPHYRVVVADSRTKRDGRVIETIGKYHPKEEPSFIDIDRDRALHWLRVGAQPTEAVEALLKVTGAWQEFKGLPAPEPMKVKEPKADKKAVFEAAAKAAMAGGEEKPRKSSPAKPDKAASAKVTSETGTNVQADPSTANVEAVTSEAEAAELAEAAGAAAPEGGE